nr:hypothetical protein [Halobaculum salinum]
MGTPGGGLELEPDARGRGVERPVQGRLVLPDAVHLRRVGDDDVGVTEDQPEQRRRQPVDELPVGLDRRGVPRLVEETADGEDGVRLGIEVCGRPSRRDVEDGRQRDGGPRLLRREDDAPLARHDASGDEFGAGVAVPDLGGEVGDRFLAHVPDSVLDPFGAGTDA